MPLTAEELSPIANDPAASCKEVLLFIGVVERVSKMGYSRMDAVGESSVQSKLIFASRD